MGGVPLISLAAVGHRSWRTTAWGVALSLILAGCGGGGGGDASPQPPPATDSLSVRAAANEVSAGSGAVELDAVLVGGNSIVRWSLAGPGTLSATQGASVRYTPPPASEQRVNATARVTASSGPLIQTLDLRVNPAPGAPAAVPGSRWEIASYPKTYTSDLNWLDGRFFALTFLGGVLNSTDGITWTPRPTPGGQLMAIAQGANGFVAVGRDTVLKSVDGDTWVSAGAAGTFDYWDVAAGNGFYVANGLHGLARSADGSVWTRVGPEIGRGNAVAFGAGRFVAVANVPRVYTSVDGADWAATDLPDSQVNSPTVAYGNGRFVVTTEQSHYVSTDGLVWTGQPARQVVGYKLRFANGVFHLMGNDRIWASIDGLQWREVYSVTAVTRLAGMAEGAGRTVIADGLGSIRHRAVLGELLDAWPGPSTHLTGVTVVGDAWYAVTDHGEVLRSSDARAWETVADLPAMFRGIAYGNGRFVIASDGGGKAVYTSTDGRNWSPANAGDLATQMSAVAFGNGVYVVAGSAGQVLRSDDGERWVPVATPTRLELTGVAHGGGRFVAVSIQGEALSSVDGLAWAVVQTGLGRMLGVSHGPQGFVAVGGWGIGAGFIWTSPDGLSWTQRSDASTPSLAAVGHGNGRYIAAGRGGALLLSADGARWEPRPLGLQANLQAVAAPPGRFVAVGMGGTIVLSEQ